MKDEQSGPVDATWGLAADCGDARGEWQAARAACAVAAAPFRTRIVVNGEDRCSFLQGMLSNDILRLAPGAGVHAAFLTESAQVVADMRVHLEEERILLDCLAWARDPLVRGLERFLVADDVELTSSAAETPLLVLEGPRAPQVLAAALAVDAPLPESAYAHCRVAGGLHVARVSEVGGDGFLVCGPAERGAALVAACRDAGATQIGARALTALRLEAGVPWARVDMDESVLAMEMELQSALSFTKGCYLGQEVVERVAARGHVNRRRTGFALAEGLPPRFPAAVRAGGKEVGRISSAGHSFLLDGPLGLGLLHVKARDGGEVLRVAADGAELACRAVSLPLRETDA